MSEQRKWGVSRHKYSKASDDDEGSLNPRLFMDVTTERHHEIHERDRRRMRAGPAVEAGYRRVVTGGPRGLLAYGPSAQRKCGVNNTDSQSGRRASSSDA